MRIYIYMYVCMYICCTHIYIYIYIYVVSTSMDARSGVLARLGDDVKLSNLVGPSQVGHGPRSAAEPPSGNGNGNERVERVDLQRQTAAYLVGGLEHL